MNLGPENGLFNRTFSLFLTIFLKNVFAFRDFILSLFYDKSHAILSIVEQRNRQYSLALILQHCPS